MSNRLPLPVLATTDSSQTVGSAPNEHFLYSKKRAGYTMALFSKSKKGNSGQDDNGGPRGEWRSNM